MERLPGFSRPACVDPVLHQHQPAHRLTAVYDKGPDPVTYEAASEQRNSTIPRKVKKLKLPKRRSVILGPYGGDRGGPVFWGQSNDAIADGRGGGAVMDWAHPRLRHGDGGPRAACWNERISDRRKPHPEGPVESSKPSPARAACWILSGLATSQSSLLRIVPALLSNLPSLAIFSLITFSSK